MSAELLSLSAAALGARLARKEVSATEVTRACLQRIAAVEPRVRAFLAVDEAGALAAAADSDARRARGEAKGPLDGVPVALKDNLLAAGLPATAGSRMLEGFRPPQDATCVRRLREAGCVVLGKTNLDEFGMGSSTEASAFHPTHNPWDLARTPGGSSGGSAAAVAAGEAFAALGTDTGGSIRQPAAFTNLVGLKPTYGRVSRLGVVAYASSLDQVGPLARTVEDAALLLQALAGHDPLDATSSAAPAPDYRAELERGVQGLRVGVPREAQVDGLDPEVASALQAARDAYARLGARVVEVSLPHLPHAVAAYYLVATAEASSNLARYDGVRYGHRAGGAKTLDALYTRSRTEGFGAEVRRRILLGTFALSAGYYDAWVKKAQAVRTLVRRDFEAALQAADVLLLPASPVPPWRLGEKLDDPLAMYLLDVFTLPCNLAGLPGLSMPGGFTRGGLPLGLQLLGRAFDEATLLRAARAFEAAHDFSRRAPGLG